MSISDQSAFPAIADELLQTVERAVLKLRAISDPDAERPRAPGKWSPKQVIGHLIDSAANNHQRFVRDRTCRPRRVAARRRASLRAPR